MLKLLGMGFAAERRLFGGGSEGGGGSAEPAQRSSADVQNDINAALDASGGAWTSELNTLVSEREAAKATESAAPPPATKVENTAGLSLRVNTSSDNPYTVIDASGGRLFSSSSKTAAEKFIEANTKDEYLDAQGKSYATKKEADAANKALFAESEKQARKEGAAFAESIRTGTAPTTPGTMLGAVSPQGTYAGDGFEWKQTSGGALTRVYTGANANRGLGTDTISAGQTSDIGLKNAIAQISLDEGSSFAYSPISATDANLFSLILTGDSGRSASYADQIGAGSRPGATPKTDFTDSGGFNAAFRDAREVLGPGQTFTYGGQQYSTATAAERPDLAGPTGGITTLVAGDPRVNMPPGALPAAPVDFSVTTSGRPYTDAALQDIYVSGAEAALGPDYGVRYQDLRDTARSYGADMGVTLPAGTGGLPSRDLPVIDLGEINVPAEDLGPPLELAGLETGIGTLVQPSSGIVTDPVAEVLATQRAQEAAAAEAARVRAELEAIDALRRTTGVQPSLTSAAVDPFAATPLGPIGNVMDVGYGVGQVDPALAAEINRSKITEDQYRQAVANYQPDLGLGAFTTSSAALLGELVGELGKVATDRSIAPVGYGVGQVDPALAAAVDQRMATELGYIPSNLPQSELYGTFADLAEAGDVLRSRAIDNAPRVGREAFASPILGIDEEGNITFNTDAFLTKAAASSVPTLAGLIGAPLGYGGLAATGAGLTAGEVALEARQQAEAAALAEGYTPEQAAVIGQEAANRAAVPGAVVGGVSNVLFGPLLPAGSSVKNIIGGALEEAASEGFLEQTISNIAAETAMGSPFSNLPYYGAAVSPDEGILGAAGGATIAGIASIPPGTTAAVSPVSVAPSGPAPFTPAAPGPAPFTPGAGPAATMTVEGTATDVTPGFQPTGPTVGQIAQTPPGLLSAYEQAAESLGEAGVRNIGGAPATMMDVTAATEIINNEIAETGALSLRTAQNLENATGLGMESIRDIAESAPNVGVPRDNLITDIVTGTGGGGQIQVTANQDGSYTLRNLTTGNPQHVATVEAGQSLDEAIKVFDEVTTVGSPEAITVDTTGIASLPPTDPRLNIPPGALPAAETTPAAEPTTALVPSGPATTTTQTGVTPTTTTQTGVTPRTTTEALTGIGTTGTSGIGSLTTVGAGTQLDVAQPVDLTATPAETAEIIEFTPTEDVIEGTAVEIVGQIPGTVATTTTPAVTTVETTTTPTTLPPTSTVVPDEEEEFVTVDVEEEGPAPGGGDEEGVEVELPPDEEEEAPFECPEGYTAVKMAGRWVCQKTETSMVGRPTIGTRPYLSRVGFAGPSPRPQQLTTRTRTVTAAE